MNTKQRKSLESIFSRPTLKNVLWNDMESLLRAIGCKVVEGEGSRVSFRYIIEHEDRPNEVAQGDFHRPHPGKEAKRYQVKKAAAFLTKIGLLP
jgi:uncharacterized lipoprotein